jgi:hypothetical protein
MVMAKLGRNVQPRNKQSVCYPHKNVPSECFMLNSLVRLKEKFES